ncbi:MAG: type II secretion system protein [Phycisphaerae bacterium]|nr:type II secretion system protein [Phycisphaerae bacterium]
MPRGFTLVEMLVVISVVAILLTIVVGVTHIVLARASAEQTRTNMLVILQAIEEYRTVKGDYPPDEADSVAPGGWVDGERNWDAYCRGKKLYEELVSVPQSQAFVAKLDKDAIKSIYSSDVFVDGFEKYMEYFSDGGVGGSPVIVSAGTDSDFGTENDNIRSDNQ